MALRLSPASLISQRRLALASAVLAGVALLIAPSNLAAASGPASAGAGQNQTTWAPGSITGVVLDPGQAGLAGVCVIAAGPSGPRLTMTSAGGRYLLAGLVPGRYQVRYSSCRHPGTYFGLRYEGVLVGPGQPAILRPVTLRLTNARAEVRARLAAFRAVIRAAGARARRRPVISGTVRSAAGDGLRGMCVYVVPTSPSSPAGGMLATGRGGRYSVPGGGLPPGRYRIGFSTGCGSHANYAPQWWKRAPTTRRATILRVRKGSTFTGINARLVAGGSLTGTARGGSRTGRGLSGVCVQLIGTGQGNPYDNPYEATITGKGGRYRLVGLATGKYQVQFDPGCIFDYNYLPANYPRRVSVKIGKTTKGVDIALPKAASISGQVTDITTGRPVAGICVIAIAGSIDNGGFGVTDRQGRYTAGGLAAGRFAVDFVPGLCGNSGSYASQFYNDQPIPVPDVRVATGQAVTGVDAAMHPGGTVKGRVTSRSGKPISHICVTVTSQQDWSGAGQSPVGLLFGGLTLISINTATSMRDGSYRVANLDPGLYNVNFSGCGNGRYAAQWFHPGGGSGPAWISVIGGPPVEANAVLRPGGSISGVIKSPSGKPLADICPETFGLAGQVPYLDVIDTSFASPSSNKEGRYKLAGLGAGPYAVEFAPCSTDDDRPATWYPKAATEAASVKITVHNGRDTSGVDPVMSAGQLVTGKVISGVTGRPVRKECVEPLSVATDVPRYAATNGKGIYRLHLLPGRHTLAVFECFSRNQVAGVFRTVQVGASRGLTRADVTLPRPGAISGTLRRSLDHHSAPGACAEAFPVSGRGLGGFTQTGLNGSYVMTGLAPGTYQVRFTSACFGGIGAFASQWFSGRSGRAGAAQIRVKSGGTTRGVGAVLAGDGAISGTVRASGKGAPGVCAIAFPASGHGLPVIGETYPSGGYVIYSLTPGRYKVEFTRGCGNGRYRTQWYDGARTQATAKEVRVQADAVTLQIGAR